MADIYYINVIDESGVLVDRVRLVRQHGESLPLLMFLIDPDQAARFGFVVQELETDTR
jgi:hypothetical protein